MDESGFRLSSDELTAVFARSDATGSVIYESHRSSLTSPFGPAIALSVSGDADGGIRVTNSPNITADLNTLTYTGGSNCQPYELAIEPFDSLCSAQRSAPDAPFGVPQIASIKIDKTYLGLPYALSNGLTLYLDFLPGSGIGRASRATVEQPFGTVTNVPIDFGDVSLAHAAGPVVSEDELTLYFQRPDLGPAYGNIWRAIRSSANEPFAGVLRVAELASASGEAATWTSADGCRLYFTRASMSDSGLQGDVFVASRTPN